MDRKTVHIVCLQVPYPPDYGGVIDLFWKLKYLHESGVDIYLHCFDDGRGEQEELNAFCKEVFYYKRKKGLLSFSFKLPYIVSSRTSKELQARLLKDNHPVLLEGIHCTALLYKNVLKNRRVLLRVHNIETDYYRQLSQTSTSWLQQLYFLVETHLLKKYEPPIFRKATLNLTVSKKETESLTAQGFHNVQYLPVFLPWNAVESHTGKGAYCLYHGNLSVPENEKAALWLLENLFNQLNRPFIIAGKKPSQRLKNAVMQNRHCTLIESPSAVHMEKLVSEAHINILPAFTTSGIKLKLLQALFCGRFCIANKKMVEDTGVENLCIVAETAEDFRTAIEDAFSRDFEAAHIEQRKVVLLSQFNNRQNAINLGAYLFLQSAEVTTAS